MDKKLNRNKTINEKVIRFNFKKCNTCNNILPLEDFSRRGDGRYQGNCRDCQARNRRDRLED